MDIFNLTADDFIAQATQKVRQVDENIFDPDVSQGQNGVYKAILRFIPWHGATSIKEIMYHKYMIKLTNPLTKEKFFADDPSTVGKSSIFWTLDTKLKALDKEEPELAAELRKSFNRHYKYYALAYIKKDPQNPQNEGKIKVVPMGYQIHNLFEQQINPQDAELGVSAKVNPFDLLNGKDFVYVAKKKTQHWRDFTGCKFMDQTSPLIIKNQKGQEIPYSADAKVQGKFKEFLVNNSPDLSQYFYKEWTDEMTAKSIEFLKAAIPTTILDEVISSCRDNNIKEIYNNSKSAKSTAGAVKATSLTELAEAMRAIVDTKSTDANEDLFAEETPAASKTSKKKTAPVVESTEDDDMFADL